MIINVKYKIQQDPTKTAEKPFNNVKQNLCQYQVINNSDQ